jgi:hypothetical protein
MHQRTGVHRIAVAGVTLVATMLAVLGSGCAHSRTDPFVSVPLARDRVAPPDCFSAPLADCVKAAPPTDAGQRLASPWRVPFQPDLKHRLCRGDEFARARFLEGVRQVPTGEASRDLRQAYLSFLGGCASSGFCAWADGVAGDAAELIETRRLFFEAAWRGCEGVLGRERLARTAEALGDSVEGRKPWVTSSRDERCAGLARLEDPWQDLVAVHGAGCLDLGEWLERHRHDQDGAAAALEQCAGGREIRYREADCLRELAGLDRARAVVWLSADERRGWGMSSTINRYARTLLRFPEPGRLEAELEQLGLVPAGPPPEPGGKAAVLPAEILERYGRLARFNPSCDVRYCAHAPLLYALVDLVSPVLDDLVIEERWPALEGVELGSGSRAVSTSVHAINVTFQVAEGQDDEAVDRDQLERLRGALEAALDEPHEILLYAGERRYRLPIRHLGEWIDLEALVGGLNTILAERCSDLRLVTLEPFCIPCAQVLAGPRDGLVAADFAGLVEVVDPFKELWTQPSFDAALVR